MQGLDTNDRANKIAQRIAMQDYTKIHQVVWPNGDVLKSGDGITLEIINSDIPWISKKCNGIEISRYNSRFVESIVWE